MNRRIMVLAALTALVTAISIAAEPSRESSIPFANLGGILDWRADGDHALYIEGRNRKWYHAELMGTCMDLPFAERIGFVIEPTGDFDRFSSILVRGQQCMLKSMVESGPPPAKAKGKAGAKSTEVKPSAEKPAGHRE